MPIPDTDSLIATTIEPDVNFELIRDRIDGMWEWRVRHIPTGTVAGPVRFDAPSRQVQIIAARALRSELCQKLSLTQPMFHTENWTGCTIPPDL